MEFSTQDLLQLVQLTLSRVDTFLITMTTIAAVFGVVIAFIVGFFTIRQINIDKEIKEYKDEVEKQKDKIIEDASKIHEKLTEASNFVSETKNQIKEELKTPLSKRTKEDLSKLQKKVEKLEEAVDIKKGEISGATFSSRGNLLSSFGDIICKKCGRSYSKNITLSLPPIINYPFLSSGENSKCPHCGNIN